MPEKKEVYIVGGPNGSGKTTFIKQFLPEYGYTTNFINVDDIAAGLSPLNFAAMNLKSGRLMLELVKNYRKLKSSIKANLKCLSIPLENDNYDPEK